MQTVLAGRQHNCTQYVDPELEELTHHLDGKYSLETFLSSEVFLLCYWQCLVLIQISQLLCSVYMTDIASY